MSEVVFSEERVYVKNFALFSMRRLFVAVQSSLNLESIWWLDPLDFFMRKSLVTALEIMTCVTLKLSARSTITTEGILVLISFLRATCDGCWVTLGSVVTQFDSGSDFTESLIDLALCAVANLIAKRDSFYVLLAKATRVRQKFCFAETGLIEIKEGHLLLLSSIAYASKSCVQHQRATYQMSPYLHPGPIRRQVDVDLS